MPTGKVLPNILVTGTPATGKTYLCEKIAKHFSLEVQNVSDIVREHDFTEGYDGELECPFLDEDKLLDYLEPLMQKGGNIVEYHSNEFFPERWFQLVLVVRCSTQLLFDRLQARGYNSKKIDQNMQCEIFGTIMEEAQDSYKPEIVKEVWSESEDHVQECIQIVQTLMDEHNKET